MNLNIREQAVNIDPSLIGEFVDLKHPSDFYRSNTIVLVDVIDKGANQFCRINFERSDDLGWKKENGKYSCGKGEGFKNLWSTFVGPNEIITSKFLDTEL